MNLKSILITFVFCLFITVVNAQYVKSITYTLENPRSALNLEISGQFAGKKLHVVEHTVVDGKANIKLIGSSFLHQDSILCFSILSISLPDDIIQLQIFPETVSNEKITEISSNFSIKNSERYILMQTYLDGAFPENDIPLFAFTAGLEKTIEYNGQLALMLDYCGLRDAHISPDLWTERFGVLNFVYYTLRFD